MLTGSGSFRIGLLPLQALKVATFKAGDYARNKHTGDLAKVTEVVGAEVRVAWKKGGAMQMKAMYMEKIAKEEYDEANTSVEF